MDLMPELVDAYRFARRREWRPIVEAQGLKYGGDYLWGIARVTIDPDFYQPDPEGRAALIVGAFEHGTLIDLVAVSRLFGMRRRRGDADLLGADALDDARWDKTPLHLYPDAWSWLRAGQRGAVIVNWRAAVGLLSDLNGIRCETQALADRIDRAFARPHPRPPLLVLSSQPKPKPKES